MAGYYILTYGCQMNERDSEVIAGLLNRAGYEQAVKLEDADLVVFNTCAVRHSAENKVFGKLGEIKRLKNKKAEMIVAFGGCMAQIAEVREKLQRLGVDVVFGTHNLHELPELLERYQKASKPVLEVWDKAGPVVEGLPSCRRSGVTAYVNIMFGCNNFCSYCIVPYVRGRERSRKPESIVAEIRELADKGVREVTLLGQNVNSYGRGLDEAVDFADLLERVNEIPGIERIRFTTSHPRDVNKRLISAMSDLDKVCEHLHAPLQAGSNRILKLMNRGYTREYYFDLCSELREAVPGIAITSDLIVGFPGEEESDFMDTLDAVERIRFEAAFTFMYSPRTGTAACQLPDQVPREVKHQRLMRLNELQYRIALEINQKMVGKVYDVLVEGPSKTNPDKLTGRTRTNHIVIFDGPTNLIGQTVGVRINSAGTFTLFGLLAAEGNEESKEK